MDFAYVRTVVRMRKVGEKVGWNVAENFAAVLAAADRLRVGIKKEKKERVTGLDVVVEG